jgi:bleomycin hydrolase
MRSVWAQSKDLQQMQSVQKEVVERVYCLLSYFIGSPPASFLWRHHKSGDTGPISPLEFYAQFVQPVYNVDDYVCIVNAPNKPFCALTIQALGNCELTGDIVRYINVPIEDMRLWCQQQLEDGLGVWMGCDYGKAKVSPNPNTILPQSSQHPTGRQRHSRSEAFYHFTGLG